jgi:hypothetical protein
MGLTFLIKAISIQFIMAVSLDAHVVGLGPGPGPPRNIA